MRTVHVSIRSFARVAAATAVVAVGLTFVASPATAAPARSSGSATAATVAAGWLGRQFEPDGDLATPKGETGVSFLPLAIVALDSARVGAGEIRRGIAYLERHFAPFVEPPESRTKSVPDPGRLAEVILAAVAAKADPWRFGGDTARDDLVARLLATQARSGTDKGLFGSPKAPTYASAYTQGLSLAALAAVGHRDAAAARWLVAQQCGDGGWETYRAGSQRCPAPNPKTYTGPDTNDTALAVEGLAASHVSPKLSPLRFLRSSQYANGGFAYYGGRSDVQAPDPDSTAVVAQALVALGKLSAVTRGRRTADDALSAFRLGCASPARERGAYRFPGEPGANLYATIQAIPATMREAYPIPPRRAAGALPVMSCK